MTKVVFKKLMAKPASARGVRVKIVRDKSGSFSVLNADSESLSSDLDFVFAKNVNRARRSNKQIVGTVDFVPRKG